MCVWMSGIGDEGICVEVKGDMIKYVQDICNSRYPMHVTLMYASTANLLNIIQFFPEYK